MIIEATKTVTHRTFDPETRAQLKALGYSWIPEYPSQFTYFTLEVDLTLWVQENGSYTFTFIKSSLKDPEEIKAAAEIAYAKMKETIELLGQQEVA